MKGLVWVSFNLINYLIFSTPLLTFEKYWLRLLTSVVTFQCNGGTAPLAVYLLWNYASAAAAEAKGLGHLTGSLSDR